MEKLTKMSSEVPNHRKVEDWSFTDTRLPEYFVRNLEFSA